LWSKLEKKSSLFFWGENFDIFFNIKKLKGKKNPWVKNYKPQEFAFYNMVKCGGLG
jgi:hypothetical protein